LQDFSRVYSININPLLYHLQSFWFTISERTWVHCRHSHTFAYYLCVYISHMLSSISARNIWKGKV